MNPKYIFIGFYILMAPHTLVAQNIFKVLGTKGKVYHASESVVTGKVLDKFTSMKLETGGYALLLETKSEISIELHGPGNYSMADVQLKMNKNNTPTWERYKKYVVDKMLEEKKEQLKMGVAGAVERGESIIASFPMHDTSKVNKTPIITNLTSARIRWLSEDGNKYLVKVTDMFDAVFFEATVTDTFFTVDLGAIASKNNLDKFLLTIVTLDGKKGVSQALHLVTKAKNDHLYHEIMDAKALTNAKSALDQLRLAHFYAKNGLYFDAKGSFEAAMASEPGVGYYMDQYNKFLADSRTPMVFGR